MATFRRALYTPTKVDRVLHDGDEVKLGGAVLVAHLTPGHTKGCTTWTMKVQEAGKTYNVVIIGSPNVNPGYRLVNNAAYPQIAADYEKMFRVLKSLPCDIFLGAHGNYFDLETKYARLKEGASAPSLILKATRSMWPKKNKPSRPNSQSKEPLCRDLSK